jgi:hypothetical protein
MVRRHMTRAALPHILLAAILLAMSVNVAEAQSPTPGGMPPPQGMSLVDSNAMRFPQPVRVGNLLGEDVLRPVESQQVLGRVHGLVRDGDGQVMVVMDFGGFLGFGSRLIAVPVNAMVLLGKVMEVVAYTPKQLRRFPTFSPAGTTELANDTIIKVGLAKPSH